MKSKMVHLLEVSLKRYLLGFLKNPSPAFPPNGKPPEGYTLPPNGLKSPEHFEPPKGFPDFPPDDDFLDGPPDFPSDLPPQGPPPKGKPPGGPGGPPGLPRPTKNLMFEPKTISPFKLVCHLSGKYEIMIIILGIIGSLGSGLSGPIMSLLMGDSINTFANDSVTDEESYVNFKFDASPMVKKFLWVGAGMFVVNFLGNSMWNYVGLLQIYHLKEKRKLPFFRNT